MAISAPYGGQWVIVPDAVWKSWNYTTATTITANTYTTRYEPWQWATTNTTVTGNWVTWNNTYVETKKQKEARLAAAGAQLQRYADEQAAWEAGRAEREARAAEMRAVQLAEMEKRAEERDAANKKARELLLSLLDAQQKRDLLEHGWFEVISNRGRRWRIRSEGIAGNVDLMPEEGDLRRASYCGHPPGRDGLPVDDHLIAQKLLLDTDEDRFTNVAYIHYRRDPQDPLHREAV